MFSFAFRKDTWPNASLVGWNSHFSTDRGRISSLAPEGKTHFGDGQEEGSEPINPHVLAQDNLTLCSTEHYFKNLYLLVFLFTSSLLKCLYTYCSLQWCFCHCSHIRTDVPISGKRGFQPNCCCNETFLYFYYFFHCNLDRLHPAAAEKAKCFSAFKPRAGPWD